MKINVRVESIEREKDRTKVKFNTVDESGKCNYGFATIPMTAEESASFDFTGTYELLLQKAEAAKWGQTFYESDANALFPSGCKCTSTNGGGDCDWCHIYYDGPPDVDFTRSPLARQIIEASRKGGAM